MPAPMGGWRAFGLGAPTQFSRMTSTTPNWWSTGALELFCARSKGWRGSHRAGPHWAGFQVARRVSELLEDILGVYVPVIDPNQAGFGFYWR